jgi:thiamine transporter ThiT
MLSNGFDKPLLLTRKPSRLLAAYLALLHTLGVLALLQALAIPTFGQVGLWILLTLSAGFHARYHRRQCDHSNTGWVWQASGAFVRGNDDAIYSLITNKSVCTPWFVILTVTGVEQRPRRLLFIRDQLDVDTFRRLRVRLQLHYDDTASSNEPA